MTKKLTAAQLDAFLSEKGVATAEAVAETATVPTDPLKQISGVVDNGNSAVDSIARIIEGLNRLFENGKGLLNIKGKEQRLQEENPYEKYTQKTPVPPVEQPKQKTSKSEISTPKKELAQRVLDWVKLLFEQVHKEKEDATVKDLIAELETNKDKLAVTLEEILV